MTAADVGFALAHARTFDLWEANPLARAVGLEAAVVLRVAGTCALQAASLGRQRLATPAAVLLNALVALWSAVSWGCS